MISLSGFTSGAVTIRAAICRVLGTSLFVVTNSRAKCVVVQLAFIFTMGGVAGLIGPTLAQVIDLPGWANVLSGALGAITAVGFETVLRWTVTTRVA